MYSVACVLVYKEIVIKVEITLINLWYIRRFDFLIFAHIINEPTQTNVIMATIAQMYLYHLMNMDQ
jgi:hypothetical protein